MFIDFWILGQALLVILGIVLITVLIIALLKLIKTVSSVNVILARNDKNIDEVLNVIPKTINNLYEITDNVKDVTEVVVETAASALGATESFQRYLVYIADILTIVKKIFSTK